MKKSYTLPIVVFVLWGSLYVVSKPAMEGIPPVTLLFLRLAIAVLVLAVILKKKYGALPRIRKAHRRRFVTIGFLGYGAGLACLQISNDMLDASLSSLLNALCPVVIFILAGAILHEKIGFGKIAGILLAIAGVYLIVGKGGGEISAAGLIIACVSVFLWSLAAVLTRAVSEGYDPLAVAFFTMGLSLIPLSVCSAVEISRTGITLSLPVVLSVIYLGLVATAAANILWNVALCTAPASTCSMFYPVQALSSALMGIVFLGEQLTAGFIAGSVVISAGIIIAAVSDSRSAYTSKFLSASASRPATDPSQP